MGKEICISSTPQETRLAILEDDQLAEIYYERENEYTLAGSIYNGRVTRVLPGMQSAFVDVGLERDAFLYVTDFLELEDSEETDELEKATLASGNQPPREVRHQTIPGENNVQRAAQKPIERQDPRQDNQARGRRLTVESIPEAVEAPAAESLAISGQTGSDQDDSSSSSSRRWRGRRRRRGGGSSAGSPQSQSQADSSEGSTESRTPSPAETEVAPSIQAATGVPGDRSSSPGWSTGVPGDRSSSPGGSSFAPAPRAGQAPAPPVPFVLPGESLSKYGGKPEEDAPQSRQESAAPARPASTFKPSTLIDAPLAWDGSGLLPGESLSRHRTSQPEPAVEAELVQSATSPDENEEEDFVSEHTFSGPESVQQSALESTQEELLPEIDEDHLTQEELFEEDEFEETAEAAPRKNPGDEDPEDYEIEPPIDQPSVDDDLAEPNKRQDESEDKGPNASASHNLDPFSSSGFRLLGIDFGKKKEEPAAPPKSNYKPGSGHIVEEVIEGEEFDLPHHPHHGKSDDHDLEDFEEETLPKHLRTAELGEMFQEAHLDHRIQLNFDSKDGDEEDDEETAVEGQPSAGTQVRQRPDRSPRGRRGRGAPPAFSGAQGNHRGPSRRSMQTSDLPVISDLLKAGQEILVQIAKEPIAKKGARITSHIALPGRFLVFMPTVTHIGVSRKIASEEERHRLKRILVHERGEASGGFIVRTAAEGASEDELRTDLRMLLNLWADIKKRSDESKSPALIYHDLGLIERILRDQVSSDFNSIWVDSELDYERIVRFLNRFSPSLVRRVKLYTKETPLFEHFGIQDEISKALRSKVWLKSGGSIVINQTEALVAIDINTGKYVGKSARLEDTIVKTNLDAVPEIVRQIRLRDLGGIIVIDFIDMDDRKNRFKVLAALEEALKSDRAPTKVLQFNDFGLVAITRKRVKQSLERTLSVPCPVCQATGMVKSPTTVCNEIYVELRKMKKHFEGEDVLLRVHPETVKVLKSNGSTWIPEFEELVGKNILIKSDPTLHPEQFDIQG